MLEKLWKKKRRKKPLSPELQAYFETPEGQEELKRYFATPEGKLDLSESMGEEIRMAHPPLFKALWGDASNYSSLLMGPPRFSTKGGFIKEALRLSVESDAFLPMALYRIRTRFLAREVPLVPEVLHRLCMVLAQIDIGKNVNVEPGVYIPHGQVVIDGRVRIGSGAVISPWVTLGRNGESLDGPTIGHHVFIGTGAKILGPVKVGDYARIGANAVVLKDVPAYATVGGVPAKILRDGHEREEWIHLRDAIRREAGENRKRPPPVDKASTALAAPKNPVPTNPEDPEGEAHVKEALRLALEGRSDADAEEFREAVRKQRLERERALAATMAEQAPVDGAPPDPEGTTKPAG